jgi:hypothetical protein
VTKLLKVLVFMAFCFLHFLKGFAFRLAHGRPDEKQRDDGSETIKPVSNGKADRR